MPLYRDAGYSRWSRHLHSLMPLSADARLLFDSTVNEPVELLADAVTSVFSAGVDGRYESVFARGNPRLIAALARRYGVAMANILPTTGVVTGLRQLLTAFLRQGDRVLVETPCFDVLPAMVARAGGEVVPLVRAFPDYEITPQGLEAALCPRTRMVVISDLHNPSGQQLGETRLAALEAVARRHGVWLVVDEVYADLSRPTIAPLPVLPNLVRLNSLSKVFGLHGLRCGWITAEASVVDAVADANALYEFGPSKLSHAVAVAVLEAPAPFEAHSRDTVARYRAVLEHHLEAMRIDGLVEGNLPGWGCMAFPRLTGHSDTMTLAQTLWREHGLVSAPGEMFGTAGHMRLGMGSSIASMDDGLARLHRALRSLSLRATA